MRTVTDIWASGDYAAVARHLTSAGEACVRAAEAGPRDDVLDVACGTGNATIPAARAGARVTSIDITPRLLEIGAQEAERAGVEIDWIEGDAEALPFAGGSFDAVLSVFGVMFAPDHADAAGELLRVLRPGGRIVVTSWTPEGAAGQLLATVAAHVGAPDGDPPVLWGTEAHVRALFGDAEFTRAVVRFEFASADAAVEFYATSFGPIVAAREALGEGWAALRADLAALFARHDVARGDGFAFEGEYLTAVVRR